MENHNKCHWCLGDPLYEAYHDQEWGVPVYDDNLLFEFLVLETFQAGLSWITILRKRENFRAAFDQFDYHRIANYGASAYDRLLQDPGIIRHGLKIKGTISNAQAFIKVQEEWGSFSKYIWSFIGNKPIKNQVKDYKQAPSTTNESLALSKDLKKRGFKFVGPTVIYAFMQAVGMVNDHEVHCYRYNEV